MIAPCSGGVLTVLHAPVDTCCGTFGAIHIDVYINGIVVDELGISKNTLQS